jgi:arylsulfatase A-like enzyme
LLRKYLKTAPSEPVARYWACVEWFDETCGQLIDHLDARKLREDTVIVYTCDNGWLQDPGNRDRFLARSKLSPYEGGLRTPILFSRPGTIAPRVDRNTLASNIDIWPTLASLLGSGLPPGLPGVDLTSPTASGREYIHGADFSQEIADLADPAASLRSRWIIEGPWKLILPDPRNRPQAKAEPHHLLRDPWEREDLAAGEPQRVRHLSGLLDREWQRK